TRFPDHPPAKVGVPISDLSTALYVALGVVSTLYERRQSGLGQYLDGSLFESAVSLAWTASGGYFGSGAVSRPAGSEHQAQAPYQAIEVRYGYVTIGANTPANWTRFCSAFDLAELENQPKYAEPALRFANREALIAVIEDRLRDRTIAEVVEEMNRVGVPAAPINDYDQAFNDVHLHQRHYFWSSQHPRLRDVTTLG